MSAVEKSHIKNAPLSMPADREAFVDWATAEPDGTFAAGWQAAHSRLLSGAASEIPVRVTFEPGLLARVDAYTKARGMSRAELLARGAELAMAEGD